MQKAVAEGRFREDLYYRLSTVQISVPPLRDRGNDILLLARKFASDFSERYRMPAITLDETARQLLLHYRWPGNVRQLKNVIEQLSLFDAGNLVDSQAVRPYLPQGTTVYTPTVTHEPVHDYNHERELLFNMILRLQQEVKSLREQIEDRKTGSSPAVKVTEYPRTLVRYEPPITAVSPASHVEAETVEPHEVVPGGMTLEETERETIRRSLENNSGRRKATARELNISERTLYRKIKEYGLD